MEALSLCSKLRNHHLYLFHTAPNRKIRQDALPKNLPHQGQAGQGTEAEPVRIQPHTQQTAVAHSKQQSANGTGNQSSTSTEMAGKMDAARCMVFRWMFSR